LRVCVDTTILLDILKDEFRLFQEILYSALSARETLVIPTVVFAELMPQFKGDTKMVSSFLQDHKIRIESLNLDAVSIAGARWMKYLKRKSRARCPNCGKVLSTKDHFLSDFYIGGFALVKCEAILTRDRSIYKKYFPDLQKYEALVKSKKR